jgi:hypothetical protein
MSTKLWRYALGLILVVNLSFSQQRVPVGSTENVIILTINNASSLPLPDLTVRVAEHPSWLTMASSQVKLPLLAANSQQEATFSFSVDPSVPAGEDGAVRFEITSPWGNTWTKVIELVTIAGVSARLDQNYPNPFNPTTLISYQIPSSAHVKLTVYNLLGQQLALLVDEQQQAGAHQVVWDARSLPTGLYVYELRSTTADGAHTSLRRTMLLLK